jgi:hypothetical protein
VNDGVTKTLLLDIAFPPNEFENQAKLLPAPFAVKVKLLLVAQVAVVMPDMLGAVKVQLVCALPLNILRKQVTIRKTFFIMGVFIDQNKFNSRWSIFIKNKYRLTEHIL